MAVSISAKVNDATPGDLDEVTNTTSRRRFADEIQIAVCLPDRTGFFCVAPLGDTRIDRLFYLIRTKAVTVNRIQCPRGTG